MTCQLGILRSVRASPKKVYIFFNFILGGHASFDISIRLCTSIETSGTYKNVNGVIKSAKAGQKNKLFYRFNQEGKGQLFSL